MLSTIRKRDKGVMIRLSPPAMFFCAILMLSGCTSLPTSSGTNEFRVPDEVTLGFSVTAEDLDESDISKTLIENWMSEDANWLESVLEPADERVLDDYSIGEFADICGGQYWIALRDQTPSTLDGIDIEQLSADDERILRTAISESMSDGWTCQSVFQIGYAHERAAERVAKEGNVNLCLPDQFKTEGSALFVDHVRSRPELRDRPMSDLSAILADAIQHRFRC